MKYAFEKANLSLTPDDVFHKKWLEVANVVLEVIVNPEPANPTIKNPALNGKYVVKGVFDHHCIPNQSPINKGHRGNLKLWLNNKYAVLPILFIEWLDITTPAPRRRCYTWYFGGLHKPVEDQIGLLPSSGQGEISLDELLEEIGASREMMEKSSVRFNAEGGFS